MTTLYNGIVLPAQWPPVYTADQFSAEAVARRTTAEVPYLLNPPKVIPIDVGRQLLVDDFLIGQTTLRRICHRPDWHPGNPVLKPDRPWEINPGGEPSAAAMPFSDGIWYDPSGKLFKIWYLSAHARATAYARSLDGIHWEKPDLDVVAWEGRPSNLVNAGIRDSSTVWLDLEEPDFARRYKMISYEQTARIFKMFFSGDGIHWSPPQNGCPVGDRSTVFFNPFRRIWVASIKDKFEPLFPERFRRYREHHDLLSACAPVDVAPRDWWKALPLWSRGDSLDPRRHELDVQPQLYNLDAVAYESVMLGFFTIWTGQPLDRPKPNYVAIGFSRDGFHWHRPDRRPFLNVSEQRGDWNWGNVQSAGGGCLVVGDRLHFYCSGRAGMTPGLTETSPGTDLTPPGVDPKLLAKTGAVTPQNRSGVSSTGLAFLRRDGFASMEADDEEGTLITRPLVFKGKYLFVNAAIREGGALRAEALGADGRAIAPFTLANCRAVTRDSTCHSVGWAGAGDLAALAGKPVRFRFSLRQGGLYAFWVSLDETGASRGYVAAGGPGLTSPTDTIGCRALSGRI